MSGLRRRVNQSSSSAGLSRDGQTPDVGRTEPRQLAASQRGHASEVGAYQPGADGVMESQSFADYLAIPALNASVAVHWFKSWKQVEHVQRLGYTPKTDTRVGSALHSMTEMLPVRQFEESFAVEPDFASSPHNVDAKGNASTSSRQGARESQ